MGYRRSLSLLVGLAVAAAAYAGPAKSAAGLVNDAVLRAKAEHKGVLVIFHASWCGWCHELDKSLAVPALKSVMDKDFVVLHVTVLENAAHKSDENPGGTDLLEQWGGKDSGIPYFVTLDGDGKMLANSKVKEANGKLENMGFPTETVEISHFVDMLKASNPALSDADEKTVVSVLNSRAAEIKAAQHH